MDKNKYKEEMDFLDLLKNPIRLFGWIYPLVLLLVIGVGIIYIKNMDEISFNEIEPLVPESSEVKDKEMKKGAVLPAVNLEIVKSATPDLLQRGKELYDANCTSCHGSKGLGNGTAGAGLNPPPRNFAQEEGWTNSRDMVGMYQTLQEGILKNGMAAYEYIIPEERLAILHYIKTLAQFPEVSDEQVQELNLTYGFSEEITTSNQIPVKLAVDKLVNENSVNSTRVNYALNYIKYHGDELSDEIVEQSAFNAKKALSTMLKNESLLNFSEFKESLASDPIGLGFKAGILQKSETDLRSLHAGLVNLISKSNVE